jgi:hypothetical protein
MINEFLTQNAVQVDDCPFSDSKIYAMPPGMLVQIAAEFSLEYTHGSTLALTTTSGEEIELVEATVH